MKVNILTFNLKEVDAKTQAKAINWNDSSDRKWLMNHMHWAMNNSHGVTLAPESN